MGYNSNMTKEVIMKEKKLVQVFQKFAEDQAWFGGQIPQQPFLQLIASFGFTEDKSNPKTELMKKLIDALGFELDDVAIQEVLEGDVY
jgi:hypothetical protein